MSEVEVKEGRAIDTITGKYFVKPIKETWLKAMNPDHNGAIMFDKAVYSYAVERHYQTGLAITGLTDQEARELEKEMNLPEQSLSPYNIYSKGKGQFCWGTFSIPIKKEGILLDCDRSARDKLHYKVLAAGSKVAKSKSELALSPLYELLMVSSEVEAKNDQAKYELKRKAYEMYGNMNVEEKLNFLNVYKEGRYKVSKDSKSTFIDAEVGKIVEGEPKEFIDTLTSPHYKNMIFISKCMAANLIYKQGTRYLTASGDELGNSLLETINNLESEDYQGAKISLMSKLEARDADNS